MKNMGSAFYYFEYKKQKGLLFTASLWDFLTPAAAGITAIAAAGTAAARIVLVVAAIAADAAADKAESGAY